MAFEKHITILVSSFNLTESQNEVALGYAYIISKLSENYKIRIVTVNNEIPVDSLTGVEIINYHPLDTELESTLTRTDVIISIIDTDFYYLVEYPLDKGVKWIPIFTVNSGNIIHTEETIYPSFYYLPRAHRIIASGINAFRTLEKWKNQYRGKFPKIFYTESVPSIPLIKNKYDAFVIKNYQFDEYYCRPRVIALWMPDDEPEDRNQIPVSLIKRAQREINFILVLDRNRHSVPNIQHAFDGTIFSSNLSIYESFEELVNLETYVNVLRLEMPIPENIKRRLFRISDIYINTSTGARFNLNIQKAYQANNIVLCPEHLTVADNFVVNKPTYYFEDKTFKNYYIEDELCPALQLDAELMVYKSKSIKLHNHYFDRFAYNIRHHLLFEHSKRDVDFNIAYKERLRNLREYLAYILNNEG